MNDLEKLHAQNEAAGDNNGAQPQIVNAVQNLKLPSFWVNNPQCWFVQAEAQFQVYKIVSDTRRYFYTVSSLPPEACESVYDILITPPDVDKYESLKKALIKRHALSEESRLTKLLEKADLGDQKPSDLYRQMKRLAGETVGDTIINKLWMRRLPNSITIPLIAIGDKNQEDLSALADKIFEASQEASHISKVSASGTGEYQQRLARIESILSEMQLNHRDNRRRSQSRNRQNRNEDERHKFQQCWYHFKFGEKARKCVKPCTPKPKKTPGHKQNSPN